MSLLKAVTLSLAFTFTVNSYSQETTFSHQVAVEEETGLNIQEASIGDKVDYLINKDLTTSTSKISIQQCASRGGVVVVLNKWGDLGCYLEDDLSVFIDYVY